MQACATAHEKAQVTARAQKAEEYEKSSSVLESIQGTSFAQLDLAYNRPVAPVSNCHRHTHISFALFELECLYLPSHHCISGSGRDG